MSSSVVSPIALTTTTTSCPARCASATRLATRLMLLASATDEPPYFCTIRATGELFRGLGTGPGECTWVPTRWAASFRCRIVPAHGEAFGALPSAVAAHHAA